MAQGCPDDLPVCTYARGAVRECREAGSSREKRRRGCAVRYLVALLAWLTATCERACDWAEMISFPRMPKTRWRLAGAHWRRTGDSLERGWGTAFSSRENRKGGDVSHEMRQVPSSDQRCCISAAAYCYGMQPGHPGQPALIGLQLATRPMPARLTQPRVCDADTSEPDLEPGTHVREHE